MHVRSTYVYPLIFELILIRSTRIIKVLNNQQYWLPFTKEETTLRYPTHKWPKNNQQNNLVFYQ